MSDDNVTSETYLCILQEKDNPFPGVFRMSDSIDELVAWAESGAKAAKPAKDPEQAASGEEERSQLDRMMDRIVDVSHQQFEMTDLLSMVRQVFPASMVRSEVVDGILSETEKVKSEDKYNIHRVPEDRLGDLIKAINRVTRMAKGLGHLPNAILLSIVATFDSQMSDIVRIMLALKSDKLRSGQRQIPLAKIMAATSLEQVIDDAIGDEVYQFSRNSHDDQVKYIEEHFDVAIRKHWKRWPDIIEVFETRNLVAHGEKTYTGRYVEICTRHGHKGSEKSLGTPLKISSNYLRQSLSLLTEFAVLLTFSLWRKHEPKSEQKAFDSLSRVVYELISTGRAAVAVFISEFALSLTGTGIKEATRLMFVVNLASAHMHSSNKEGAMRVLDGVDWSATADNYKICVAALRTDVDEVNRLMPLVAAAKTIESDDFRTWPVFKFIRDESAFKEAFQANFGQRFERGKNIGIEKTESPAEPTEVAAEEPSETRH